MVATSLVMVSTSLVMVVGDLIGNGANLLGNGVDLPDPRRIAGGSSKMTVAQKCPGAMEIQKYDRITDQLTNRVTWVGARDTCVSENTIRESSNINWKFATRWRHLHWLQIWSPDDATCVSSKFSHQMATDGQMATIALNCPLGIIS